MYGFNIVNFNNTIIRRYGMFICVFIFSLVAQYHEPANVQEIYNTPWPNMVAKENSAMLSPWVWGWGQ